MKTSRAFSLIELSVVILIVGIIVAGVTQSSSLVRRFKLGTARNLTQGSPIHGVKDLIVWLDASSEASVGSLGDGDPVADWKDINAHSLTKIKFTQSDDLSKPTYKENGTNGVPGISFSSGFLTNANFPATSANYSAFIVFNKASGLVGSQDLFSIYCDSDSNHSNSTSINGALFEVTGSNFMRFLYGSDPMGSGGGDLNVSALKIGNDSGYILSYVRIYLLTLKDYG